MPLEKVPTRAELVKSPSMLTHRKADLETRDVKAFDGLSGALVADGEWIVTSPNMSQILHPALGGDRPVALRKLLRYGIDDPLQWPQKFVSDFPHLPFIPAIEKDISNPLRILHYLPTPNDFNVEASLLQGIGHLNPHILYLIHNATSSLIARADRETSDALAKKLANLLQAFSDRLFFLPTSFTITRRLFRETQRLALELHGRLAFLQSYLPLLRDKTADPPKAIANVVGAFTMDLGICEDLYRIGVPVYLIRPADQIMTMCIREAVEAKMPHEALLEEAEPPYPCLYRGPPSKEKYMAIHAHTARLVSFPDAFNSSSIGRRTEPPPPTEAQLKRQGRSAFYSPYQKKNKKTKYAPAGRDKFEDPIHEMYPPPIPAWSSALQNVDRSLSHVVGENIPDTHYAFPEPASIISVENPRRREACFETWLKYRTALIHRLTSSSSNACAMPSKAWRILLSINYLENANPQTDSRSAQRRQTLKDFLSNTLDSEVTMDPEKAPSATWQSKPFSSLENPDFEEILWELAELNFRQELMALDFRLMRPSTPEAQQERRQKLSACFVSGQLLAIPLSDANHGLASLNRDEQTRYLLAFQRLVRDWPGEKPSIISLDQVRWRDPEVDELERALAELFTQTFFNYFKRAAVVPRRLSHNVPGATVPQPVLTYQNPAPMLFYDLDYLYTLTDFSK